MRRIAILLIPLAISACSKPSPPVGRWEGGYSVGGTIVVARVEVESDGQVRVSAPDITNFSNARPEQYQQERETLAADLATGWDGVLPRPLDFDGTTFRKPGGIAPQMVWDKATGQMTLELYIGANPALPVPLRPVDSFHDNPFAAG